MQVCRLLLFACLFFISVLALITRAEDAHIEEAEGLVFTVSTAFLDIRSGPARGFPVIHALRRDDNFIVISQKTGWYEIRYEKKEGWISRKQLLTTTVDGKGVEIVMASAQAFENKRWEIGFASGEVHGANNSGTPVLSLYTGYHFTPNLSIELTASQVLGKYSESVTGQLNIAHEFAPDWIVTPIFSLGIGTIETDPRVTLGNTNAVENDALNWGLGAKAYIANRFFARLDYNKYLLLSQNDDVSTVESWKLGLGVFF